MLVVPKKVYVVMKQMTIYVKHRTMVLHALVITNALKKEIAASIILNTAVLKVNCSSIFSTFLRIF